MKKFCFLLVGFIFVSLTLCGCATVNRMLDSEEKNKSMYTVKITSKTPGLMVYTTKGVEKFAGKTPCYIYSDKTKIKYVTVKSGNTYQTIKLETKPRTSSYWNFVPYPMYNWIWGFFLDQGTGRGKTYSQKEYYVDL